MIFTLDFPVALRLVAKLQLKGVLSGMANRSATVNWVVTPQNFPPATKPRGYLVILKGGVIPTGSPLTMNVGPTATTAVFPDLGTADATLVYNATVQGQDTAGNALGPALNLVSDSPISFGVPTSGSIVIT